MNEQKFKTIMIFGSLSLALVLMFNNCSAGGGNKDSGTVMNSSNSPDNNSAGIPISQSSPIMDFKIGDTLTKPDLQKISSVLGNFYDTYSKYTAGLKGMAITSDSLNALGVFGYKNPSSGFDSFLISLCNARFQKKCVILAKGDNYNISSADLEDLKKTAGQGGMITSIKKGDQIDVSSFPINQGSQTISDYIASTGIKSMAVSWNGALIWQSNSNKTYTQAELSRMTIESCQLVTQKKCVLLAEGNLYSWDYKTDIMKWTLPTSGQALDLSSIPLVGNKYREDAQASSYNSVINSGGHGVIYLVPGGGAYMRASSTESTDQLKTTALENCLTTYPGKECILFAIDNSIVWTVLEK